MFVPVRIPARPASFLDHLNPHVPPHHGSLRTFTSSDDELGWAARGSSMLSVVLLALRLDAYYGDGQSI